MVSPLPFNPEFHPRGFGGKFTFGQPKYPTALARPVAAPIVEKAPRAPKPGPPKKGGKAAKPMRFDGKGAAALQKAAAETVPGKPKPFAFTDASYRAHAAKLERKTAELRAGGGTSEHLFRERNADGSFGAWDQKRVEQHQEILKEFPDGAKDVPRDGKAIFAGGLGGAGKGGVLKDHAGIPEGQYLTVNPDEIKEVMARKGMIPKVEGMSPMEANTLVHEECSDLAKELALRASQEKINVIWDITMASDSSVQSRIDKLREAGYKQIDGVFVNIDVPTSRQRAESRHRSAQEKYANGQGFGGRFLPEAETAQNAPPTGSTKMSKNAEVFERLKPQFSSTVEYNNMVPRGSPPIVESTTGPRWGGSSRDAELNAYTHEPVIRTPKPAKARKEPGPDTAAGRTRRQMDPVKIHNNAHALMSETSPEAIAEGIDWYRDNSALAKTWIKGTDTSEMQAMGIIAAFSPQTGWVDNAVDAENLIKGKPPRNGVMATNMERAKRVAAATTEDEVLAALRGEGATRSPYFDNGPKITNFYHNLMGRHDRLTMDAWMAYAGRLSPDERRDLVNQGIKARNAGNKKPLPEHKLKLLGPGDRPNIRQVQMADRLADEANAKAEAAGHSLPYQPSSKLMVEHGYDLMEQGYRDAVKTWNDSHQDKRLLPDEYQAAQWVWIRGDSR